MNTNTVLLSQAACLDLPISLTCWAPAGVASSGAVALGPALRVPAGRAHSCLGGPAHGRPVAPSPGSGGQVRAWMEKHESNGERSVGEWGERTPIPKEKTDLAEPTWLLTWAPLVFSVTWREREK